MQETSHLPVRMSQTTNDEQAKYGKRWPKPEGLDKPEPFDPHKPGEDVIPKGHKPIPASVLDEIAAGLPKAEQRAPLFSDERMAEEIRGDGGDGWPIAHSIRNFYEGLITSGELITKAQAEKMAEDAVERFKDEQALERGEFDA